MLQFTIRFTTEKMADIEWIYEQIRTGKSTNGILISAISDGDMFKRESILQEQLDIVLDNSYDFIDEDHERFKELESEYNKAFVVP